MAETLLNLQKAIDGITNSLDRDMASKIQNIEEKAKKSVEKKFEAIKTRYDKQIRAELKTLGFEASRDKLIEDIEYYANLGENHPSKKTTKKIYALRSSIEKLASDTKLQLLISTISGDMKEVFDKFQESMRKIEVEFRSI